MASLMPIVIGERWRRQEIKCGRGHGISGISRVVLRVSPYLRAQSQCRQLERTALRSISPLKLLNLPLDQPQLPRQLVPLTDEVEKADGQQADREAEDEVERPRSGLDAERQK